MVIIPRSELSEAENLGSSSDLPISHRVSLTQIQKKKKESIINLFQEELSGLQFQEYNRFTMMTLWEEISSSDMFDLI